MSVVVEFPGTAVNNSGFNTVNPTTVSLAAPAAGMLQFVELITIDLDPQAAPTRYTVTITGLAGGSITRGVVSSPNGTLWQMAFNPPFPASAAATAIGCSVAMTGGITTFISLCGYNVPQ